MREVYEKLTQMNLTVLQGLFWENLFRILRIPQKNFSNPTNMTFGQFQELVGKSGKTIPENSP